MLGKCAGVKDFTNIMSINKGSLPFLATLVALHFTPVSESASESVSRVSDLRSFEACELVSLGAPLMG